MEYDIVIGLETHIELNTKTKVFCGCENSFGGEPNTHCCPICIGLPGALPRVNKEAINKAITMGLVTNCIINKDFYFDRKHYFYPDLAKAYQISQDNTPVCVNGYVELKKEDGSTKKIRIRQIHLEEDAGKLIHSPMGESYVDYNRGGVPLIEIVSMPDISSVEEAITYVTYLKDIAKHTKVSDCKMEQGSLRCDVNVSLKPKGADQYGTKVEMKNINSFKAIERAIKYEVDRQLKMLENGETILPETRRWDDAQNCSFAMRSKEGAKDYRFFPEPDIQLVHISDEEIETIKNNMPLLPEELKNNLMKTYGLSDYDAGLISRAEGTLQFFNGVVASYSNAKKVANWITSEINKKLNEELVEEVVIPVDPTEFAKVLTYLDKNEISQQGARSLLGYLWEKEDTTDNLIKKYGLKIENNTEELEKTIAEIIENNPKAVEDYVGGNAKAFTFFVGQVMKATRGQANAGLVNEIIKKQLEAKK